ncbi:hypothetical protein OOU_Y34scaffold00590g12 [Pyricularia oryzae Y34]|uniref:Uncharacterized protein n=2 Tax=Pyricularia oryzae TaxID=318829 RepID=A0AA97NW73_PYRO3|nr:hypothetical protein OOU_Y34scaffold00590g12 [Pyricularia oryzae Y34]
MLGNCHNTCCIGELVLHKHQVGKNLTDMQSPAYWGRYPVEGRARLE